jgi:hypothetical protein
VFLREGMTEVVAPYGKIMIVPLVDPGCSKKRCEKKVGTCHRAATQLTSNSVTVNIAISNTCTQIKGCNGMHYGT